MTIDEIVPRHANILQKGIYHCCDGHRDECPFYYKIEVKKLEVSISKEICLFSYRIDKLGERRC